MTSLFFSPGHNIPLTSTSAILSIFGLFIITNAIHRILRWHRLRHIPGPPLAGWTSLWLTRGYLNSDILHRIQDLTAKYGPVVRIAPNKVVCSDTDALYRISSVRSRYRKDEWYTVTRISKHGDHVISLLDPEMRRERKKHIGPAVRTPLPSVIRAGLIANSSDLVPTSIQGEVEWTLNRVLIAESSPLSI